MRHLVVLVMLAGCGDDLSLQVTVQHPPNAMIDRTVVTVYESPDDSVRCSDIEFQDISETALAGLEVTRFEQNAMGTIGSLDGISRTGTKLVVARGFRNDMYIAAGCTEHGTIGGNDKVLVETQIVAAVSLGGVEAEGNDIASIPITITTPFGAPLPRRPISWRVYSYTGAKPMSSPVALDTATPDEWAPTQTTCTGTDGTIRLRPIPPSEIGGYSARVRVSWGETAPRTFSSFTRAEPLRKDLAPLSTAAPVGRLCTTRTSGATKRVVCIEDQDPSATVDPVARDLAVTVSAGQASLATMASQNFAPAEIIVAVYSVGSGTTRDAYAMTAGGRVIGLFSPSR